MKPKYPFAVVRTDDSAQETSVDLRDDVDDSKADLVETKLIDGGGSGGNDVDMDHEKRLTAIETLMPTLATKTDMAEMRADLHKMDASIKTWMIATIIGLFFGFAGLFFAMSNSLRSPTVTQAAPSPIVITVPTPAPQNMPPAQK